MLEWYNRWNINFFFGSQSPNRLREYRGNGYKYG